MSQRLPILVLPPDAEAKVIDLLGQFGLETVRCDELLEPGLTELQLFNRVQALRNQFMVSDTDSLTGLLNRRGLMADLEMETGLVEAEPLWVFMANLDHFKGINDTLGHGEGDRILAETADRFRTLLPMARGLGRIGGDTLLGALRGTRETVRDLLEKVLNSVRTIPAAENQEVTLSIGLVRQRPGEPANQLVERSDRCLFEAKNRGRDRLVDESQFSEAVGDSDLDLELADFENRIKVFADRLVSGLTGRGRRMVESYRNEADHDGLTGLFNRRYLDRRLEREVARSRSLDSPLTVVLVDLDDFGAVNRNYGFPAGDRALKAAAACLMKGIRVVDWAARYGGEELLAVFPDTGAEAAAVIADRIREALTQLAPEAVDGRKFQISGSFGVVTLNVGDQTVPHLIQRVGAAVRKSKVDGKNRVTVGV